MTSEMSRWGIGAHIFFTALFSSLFTGWLTQLYPELFYIRFVSTAVLFTIGTVSLVCGTVCYLISLRFFNRGFSQKILVTNGPFALTQNPIYSSWILFLFPGFLLFFKSWIMLTVPFITYNGL